MVRCSGRRLRGRGLSRRMCVRASLEPWIRKARRAEQWVSTHHAAGHVCREQGRAASRKLGCDAEIALESL